MLYFIKYFMLFIQFNWNVSHTDKVWCLNDLLLKKSKDIFNFKFYKRFLFFKLHIYKKKYLEKCFMEAAQIMLMSK